MRLPGQLQQERVVWSVRFCSLPADAERMARAVRSHWEIENRLHWCLDVQLNEDQSRVRSGYAANNLAIVRHIVMNLLQLNTTQRLARRASSRSA